MFGFSFHFRGRTRSLLTISQCFQEHPGVGLHPTQIARHTGYNFLDVNERLLATPELFIKLPSRGSSRGGDAVTRYRLATSVASKNEAELAQFIAAGARKETLTVYATVAIVVSLCGMILIMSFPLSSWL